MLIRTQDRKALVDMSETTIRVIDINGKDRKIVAYGNNQPAADALETLGIYGSEERAIEVLDEIQESYNKTCTAAALGGGFCIYDNKIFEMPEE